jgi:hypothetical protein
MSDDRDDRLAELLGTLREDVRAPAELRDAVMRRIEHRSAFARFAEWALRPRMVPMSPALGALAAAAVVALLLVRPAPAPQASVPVPVSDVPARVVTRFVLVAPGAASVHLTGDFNAWQREGIALEQLRGTAVWTADVPLQPGVHQYTFVLNGAEWVPDPTAVLQVDDGFGQVNSIVVVPEAGQV